MMDNETMKDNYLLSIHQATTELSKHYLNAADLKWLKDIDRDVHELLETVREREE